MLRTRLAVMLIALTAILLTLGFSSGTASAQAVGNGVVRPMLTCNSNPVIDHPTRAQVMQRAQSWIDAGVPYSQTDCYTNPYGNYRRDCSGFVSMAWGLLNSRTTETLPDIMTPIAYADLKPGDVLWRRDTSVQHVALFVRWADPATRTQPVMDEERGATDGEPALQDTWTNGFRGFAAYRYNNIVDDATANPNAATSSDQAITYTGKLNYFARGVNGAVYVKAYDGGGWGDWYSIGGDITGQPTAIEYHGALHVFAISTNGAVYENAYANGWSGWHSMGGDVRYSLSAVVYHDKLMVFATSTNAAVYQAVNAGAGWSAWTSLGGALAGGPKAVVYGEQLQVVGVSTNTAVYQLAYNGTAWGAWQNLGGAVTGTPALLVYNGAFQIYARSTNGALYQKSYNGSWSNWISLGGALGSDPEAIVFGTTAQVYAEGTDGAVHQLAYAQGSWQPWNSLGGDVTNTPATTVANGTLVVFDRGVTGNLYQKFYNGSWSDWINLGGDIL